MEQSSRQVNSPWMSLIILLGWMMFFTFLQALFAKLVGGDNMDFYANRSPLLYSMLAIGTLFTFLLPALSLRFLERDFSYFPRQQYVGKVVYGIVLLFLLAFSPVMQLVGEWNSTMSFPEAWKEIEAWMRAQEDRSAALVAEVVMVDSIPLLLLNIVVMAIFPAIAEEYFFRGSLMHIIQRMLYNYHLTIWITAIIFSAIHFQFYGFFPRLLLGAFFGYMLVWTQNIWVPVVAHFINNASVTIMAYYYARQGKTYADLQAYESYSIFVYIGAVILSVLIGYWFYRYADYRKRIYGTGLDKNMDIQ